MTSQPPHGEAAADLALAVIASSTAPLVLLDGSFAVVAASSSFYRAFQIDPAHAAGLEIFALGGGEWDVRQLRSLLKATAAGNAQIDAYEMDLAREGQVTRRLVLNVKNLDYGDTDHVRLLLAVADVTDARLAGKLKDDVLRQKDDLVREKAILLQELQHRVANSLQIIASVLLQSAKRVDSDETRTHLYDAHQRVMSVAAVQRQLAATTLGDVDLRGYFSELCESIGASMIRDHNQLKLEVTSDDTLAAADVSVSLGLIVTELVINALKHAFPGRRKGKISVDYHADGADWTLSVGDNGVGMPADAASAKAGLGTSIVSALAQQLQADVQVSDSQPGHKVSIVHEGGAGLVT
nr:sensor histidine kinase [uncultured Phenylobacterium sp.]